MSDIYQGTCTNCGHRTVLASGGCYAVFLDQPTGETGAQVVGAVLTGTSDNEFYLSDDPRFALLRHPLEDWCLAKTGYSESDLFWQGRGVYCEMVVCRQCGELFERRRLTVPAVFGCSIGLWVSICAGFAGGLWFWSIAGGILAMLLAALISMFVVSWVGGFYMRLRFKERSATLQSERFCPNCKTDRAVALYRRPRVVCACCRESTMQFDLVGIS